jgi:hypothetical protein
VFGLIVANLQSIAALVMYHHRHMPQALDDAEDSLPM